MGRGGRQLYAAGCGSASLTAPGRNVQIVKPLEDVEVMEKEGATFSCEVSHDEVPAQWFWEGTKLRPSDNVRIRQEGMTRLAGGCWAALPPPQSPSPRAEWPVFPGRTYTLIYRRVLVEEAGEIRFIAENAESRAQLRVRGEGVSGRAWVGWYMKQCTCAVSAVQTQAWVVLGPSGTRWVTQEEGNGVLPLQRKAKGLGEVAHLC